LFEIALKVRSEETLVQLQRLKGGHAIVVAVLW